MGKVGTFASQVGEFGFTQAGMLEQMKSMVDSYISKELVQDIPTGKHCCHYFLVVSACIIVFMYSNSLVPSWGAGWSVESGKECICMWCTYSDVSPRYNNVLDFQKSH